MVKIPIIPRAILMGKCTGERREPGKPRDGGGGILTVASFDGRGSAIPSTRAIPEV